MKFLIILALTLAVTTAEEMFQRNVIVPTVENEGRITNGYNAYDSQFPYQVVLLLRKKATYSSYCGGSLIGKNWVLTAAHCTQGVQSVIVYLGVTVRQRAEVSFTVSKDKIIIHAGFNAKTFNNDISLIRIPTVNYSAKIKPVRLPAIASTYWNYRGKFVIASGWGRTSDSNNGVTNNLQWARFQITSNSVCSRFYKPNTVTASIICVDTRGGVSTCNGDSGGPLVLESSKIQVGLTSFGSEYGCELGAPIAFTRLTSYLKWIKAITGISY